jgi:hypothetical protein
MGAGAGSPSEIKLGSPTEPARWLNLWSSRPGSDEGRAKLTFNHAGSRRGEVPARQIHRWRLKADPASASISFRRP